MTAISYVTQKQMEDKTGFKHALGYSLPKKEQILIRKGLPKKLENKVKRHEEEHMLKGEEGPWVQFIPAIASVVGGLLGAKGAKDAAATAAGGSAQELEFMQAATDQAREDQRPYREAGYTALDALMSLTGLAAPAGTPANAANAGATPGAAPAGINAIDYLGGLGAVGRGGSGARLPGRIMGRNEGGTLYNINELGPERVYENGSYTRSDMPRTVPPSNGYVSPNIEGRGLGGFLKNMLNPIKALSPTAQMHQSFVKPGLDKLSGGGGGAGWGGPPSLQNAPNVGGIPNQDFGDPMQGTYQAPGENPGGVEGGYQFQTDPGYNFRLGEGMRALERGAAASGGLLSGGYGRRSTRYAQDYASNEYTNVYNRISNIAGLGQIANNQSSQAALYGGAGMGTAAVQGAYASAYGQQAGQNAIVGGLNQVDWGAIFGGGGGGEIQEYPEWSIPRRR